MLSLDKLNSTVHRPQYDRGKLTTRIAHIGFGAFHKAHQAVCAEQLARHHQSDWGYCEISLFSSGQIDSIREQDYLWSVTQLADHSHESDVIGVATAALSVPRDGIEVIIDALCNPDIAIVSLTITEKGYCFNSANQRLATENESIKHDIAHPQAPVSAPGVILEALRRRHHANLAPFSVMSCDNMPHNGEVTREVIVQLALKQDPSLAQWIKDNVCFPSTMVDRIVPAVTSEALSKTQAQLGCNDAAAVLCEPFFQWVIEDRFSHGRPQWELAGATLVDDVKPYEEMKLRMLNGSHSFLAYLGYLAGYSHISDCMDDTRFVEATRQLMLDEQAPTLAVTGIDLEQYADSLIQRFSNHALKHRTWQIAMDGSQKLPQRMLASIRWHLEHESSFAFLALGIAGWMHYVAGVDENGEPIEVQDPAKDEIDARIAASSSDSRVTALLSLEAVFGQDLPQIPRFVEAITSAWQLIDAQGARNALIQTLSSSK